MEHVGCQVVLGFIMLFLVVGFLLPPSCRGAGQDQQAQNRGSIPVAAEIGSQKVTYADVEAFVQKSENQMKQQAGGALPPSLLGKFVFGNAVNQTVIGSYLLELANREKVDMSNSGIVSSLSPQIDNAIEQAKQQLIKDKKLSATASESDIDKVFTATYGRSREQIKTDELKNFERQLSDETSKRELMMSAANQGLIKYYEGTVTITDDQLKDAYQTRICKRIYLSKEKNPGVDVAKKMEGILSDLKAKKITFEDAMNRYSNDPPAEKKRVSDNTYEVDGRTSQLNKDYVPITELKLGEMTGVLIWNDGASIFRYDKLRNDLPADFEQKKATMKQELIGQLAVKKMSDSLDQMKKEIPIQWKSAGYQAVYDWAAFSANPDNAKLSPAERHSKLEGFGAAMKASLATDTVAKRVVAMSWLALIEDIAAGLTVDKKKSLDPDRIAANEAILEIMNDADTCLALADLYAGAGNKEKVADSLSRAAQYIMGFFDATGQSKFANVNTALNKHKGLLTPEQVKTIQANLDAWKKAKIDADTLKAEDDKMRKEAEARAKAEEVAAKKKAEEEAKKNATKK